MIFFCSSFDKSALTKIFDVLKFAQETVSECSLTGKPMSFVMKLIPSQENMFIGTFSGEPKVE